MKSDESTNSSAPNNGGDKPGTDVPYSKVRLALSSFLGEIDSLQNTLPLTTKAIRDTTTKAAKALGEFLSQQKKVSQDDKSIRIEIDASKVGTFRKLQRNLARSSAAKTLVPRSLLVSLVSQFDSFLGRLIEALLDARPEILNASEKQLTFSELIEFSSIDAAREHIVEREIESVLRKSHSEQFDWLEQKFDIKLRKSLDVWPEFIEVTERRNLFVHTGGQVSAQYLKVCKTHNADLAQTARRDSLSVDEAYFARSYEVLFEIGVKLAQVLWRKTMPESGQAADQNLLEISFDLLQEEKYSLARVLLDFATEVLKKHRSEDIRLRLVINRAQAYKWSGDETMARKILDAEDFSALKNVFRLADAVLREEFDSAVSIIREMGATGELSLEDYREWPLFKEIRKEGAMEKAIAEIFNEPLNKYNVEPAAQALIGVKGGATPTVSGDGL